MINFFIVVNLADTPFSQIKLGEVGSWLSRRNKSPQALVGVFSRAYWRWNHKYCQARRTGIAPYFQLITAGMIFFYCINSQRISKYLINENILFK